MSHAEMDSDLRGSKLESRKATKAYFDTEEEAAVQVMFLETFITNSGIADADVAIRNEGGKWVVHYWRGQWSPWPKPEGMASLPPSTAGDVHRHDPGEDFCTPPFVTVSDGDAPWNQSHRVEKIRDQFS